MIIKYIGSDKFEIKTSRAQIELAATISVDGFVFPGAGEYEKGGVSVTGIPNDQNTIYLVGVEEINLCYLGKIKRLLRQEEIKEIGTVDVLFLPLGEEETLPVKQALELVSKIEPKIVIPMLYSDLSLFKKSEGIADGELDSLRLRKSDIAEEEQKIVILKPKS